MRGAELLHTERLTKRYGGLTALDQLTLEIPAGSCFALFGPNGAGKSTFLKLLAGLTRPTSGHIQFQDTIDPFEYRSRIGYLGHETMLYAKLTAEENLRFFASLYGIDSMESRIRAALVAVGLEGRAKDYVGSFSRGMRQRLAIARATLHEPDLLLLDEPFTGLDPLASERASALFQTLHRAGRTLIVVTHDFVQGLALADRIAVFHHGRLVHQRNERVTDAERFRKDYFSAVGGGGV